MSVENKEVTENPEYKKNKEAFENAFANQEWMDKKAFGDLVKWAKFDENVDPNQNLQNAFDIKVWQMIEDNSKNLTPENRAQLQELKSKASTWATSPQELVEAFAEIQKELSTRSWESAKAWQDIQQQQTQNNEKQRSKELQDFVDKFKEARKENERLEWERNKDKKEQIKLAEQEEKAKNPPPDLDSTYPVASKNPA